MDIGTKGFNQIVIQNTITINYSSIEMGLEPSQNTDNENKDDEMD